MLFQLMLNSFLTQLYLRNIVIYTIVIDGEQFSDTESGLLITV